jgi:UPF0716 protein FxsA
MHVGKRIAIALLLLPAAELAVFLMAIAWLGFVKTALLTVATSLIGYALLRRAGGGHISGIGMSALRAAAGQSAAIQSGFFAALSGFLLLLPGFITDAIGLALLLPGVQHGIGARVATFFGGAPPSAEAIDLAPNEWRRLPDPEPPKRRRRSPRPRQAG